MPGVFDFGDSMRRFPRPGVDLDALRRIGPLKRGVPRSQITVPISPVGRVDDTVLYEDPADPAKVYYLPRYRLRVTPATGRYEISTALVDGLWRMTFGLESFPAPEIEGAAARAGMLQHQLTVSVSSAGQLARDYPVAEFSPGFGDTQARPEVVLLLTLPERDALLRAFTRDEEQARLVVRRTVSVAVPLAGRIPGPIPGPDIMFVAQPDRLHTHVILPDLVVNEGPNPIPEPIRHFQPLPVPGREPPEPRPDEVILMKPDEVDFLNKVVKERPPDAAVQLDQVNLRQQVVVDRSFAGFSVQPEMAAEPLLRSRVLRDRRPLGPGVLWPGPDPIVVGDDPDIEPRFLLVNTTLDVVVPLRFDVDAHPYLFPSGQPPVSRGFVTLVVPWPAEGPSSRNHVYFQDQTAGNVFYYLADSFLIGQRDEAPYGPELSFTVGRTTDPETGTEQALALISVHLVPQSSPARLVAAAAALAEHVPAGGGAPELRPAVHPATCRLELPGGAITTAARPDLVRGWWVSESFAFDDLRDVYAVLTTSGAASALLRGRVDVDVSGEVHQVPVDLRLDRPAAPPLSWTEKPGADGSVTVTLLNEGDVAVTIPELPAWIDAVPATVTGLPARLGAQHRLDLTLTPSRPVTGSSDATLDLTGVRLVVKPEEAVEQTLDPRVERLPRVVTLITTAGGLGATGDPVRDLAWIGVQFEGVSGAVLLNHDTLQRDVAVPVPLLDWLLDRGLGEFRFRQTLLHVSGHSQSDTDWRSTDSNLLALPQP